jgi:SAM-dependent methyltransferase
LRRSSSDRLSPAISDWTARAEDPSTEAKLAILPSTSSGEPTIAVRLAHDNSERMWTTYFSSRAGCRSFNSAVHLARERYHGQLFARRVVDLGGLARSYLEIGVGTGESLKRLRKTTGAHCVGVDKTACACGLARLNATECHIVSADGLSLPFPDDSFDVVYSLGLLEHFGLVDQRRLIREHARVARKSVLLHVPADVPQMRIVMWLNRRVWGRTGVWADEELFTPSMFRTKFPGLPFRSLFDWAAGGMTYWLVLKPGDIVEALEQKGTWEGEAPSEPRFSKLVRTLALLIASRA